MQEILPKIKETLRYICEYGGQIYNSKYKQELKNIKDFQRIFKDEKKRTDFFRFVHEGFQKAQLSIIQELLQFAEEKELCIQELKDANRQRDVKRKKAVQEKINEIEYKECIYRKLADTIAWQLLNHQHYIVRRLYIEGEPTNIKSINFKHSQDFIEKFNKENPCHFALLTDITSFIQISDVLIVNMEKNS